MKDPNTGMLHQHKHKESPKPKQQSGGNISSPTQAQPQQQRQPSMDIPPEQAEWDGLSHEQMVKKVFNEYGEEWLKQIQGSQIAEILDKLRGLTDKINDLNIKMNHILKMFEEGRSFQTTAAK